MKARRIINKISASQGQKATVRLNKVYCLKAQVANLRYEIAKATVELELWRNGRQSALQQLKARRDEALKDLAELAGISPGQYELDLENGTARICTHQKGEKD